MSVKHSQPFTTLHHHPPPPPPPYRSTFRSSAHIVRCCWLPNVPAKTNHTAPQVESPSDWLAPRRRWRRASTCSGRSNTAEWHLPWLYRTTTVGAPLRETSKSFRTRNGRPISTNHPPLFHGNRLPKILKRQTGFVIDRSGHGGHCIQRTQIRHKQIHSYVSTDPSVIQACVWIFWSVLNSYTKSTTNMSHTTCIIQTDFTYHHNQNARMVWNRARQNPPWTARMLATRPRLRSTRQGTDVGRGVGVGPIQVPVGNVYVYKMENKQMYFKKYVPGIKK